MTHARYLLVALLAITATAARAEASLNFGADAEGPGGAFDYARRDVVVDGALLTTGGPLAASAGGAQATVTALADPATGMFKALATARAGGGSPDNIAQAYARLDVRDTLRFSGPGSLVTATFSLSYDTFIAGLDFDGFERTDSAPHFMQAESTRSVGIQFVTANPQYDPSLTCVFGGEVNFCPPGANPFVMTQRYAGKELFGEVALGSGSSTYRAGDLVDGHYGGTVELSVVVPTNVDISLSYYAHASARCFNLISCALTVDASHSDYLAIGVSDGGSFASANGYRYLGNVASVPEPQTVALMLAGLGVVGFTARRRRAG